MLVVWRGLRALWCAWEELNLPRTRPRFTSDRTRSRDRGVLSYFVSAYLPTASRSQVAFGLDPVVGDMPGEGLSVS